VLRGIPTVIDDERIKGFEDTIKGTDLKVLDIQYAHWNSDEAFKLMQDYLAKYRILMRSGLTTTTCCSACWRREAVGPDRYQAGTRRQKGHRQKGDRRRRDDSGRDPYPPSMIKTAIYMTVANLIGQAPVRGTVKLDAPLITRPTPEYYFPDSPF
jgi:ribose transport system substrate-binding protein